MQSLDPEDSKKICAVLSAYTAIKAREGKRRGVRGEMSCPICKTGTLRYGIAASNGHVHAACTTDGCVRFME